MHTFTASLQAQTNGDPIVYEFLTNVFLNTNGTGSSGLQRNVMIKK